MNLTALLDRIGKQRSLIQKLTQHEQVSKRKFTEAIKRYRQGRIDTTDIIQFENDLHLASLDLSSAKTNLLQSKANLSLLVGQLLPQLNFEMHNQ